MLHVASFVAGCPGVFFEEGAVDGDDGAAGAQMRFSYCANSGFATSPPTMIRDLIMSVRNGNGYAAHIQKTRFLSHAMDSLLETLERSQHVNRCSDNCSRCQGV